MPKTKLQQIVFTALMVFCMVYCMTVYTIARKLGGLSGPVFLLALRKMWAEYVLVFLLIFFCITRLAQKLALRIIPPGALPPIFFTLAIQCCTVCLIVPCVTLFATLYHGGLAAGWFPQWLQLACLCFPVALCLQVFLIGPLVRLLFRALFRRQLTAQA